ncbi:MAG: Ribosomal protein S12 methylthiotransferase RimO [Eubacteriales bacterium SKADARSKE-1]|nr:Ribosomal protein S12 methylthiotransferase RimO [Eubacteriales bacterium SKADARSKE-1]
MSYKIGLISLGCEKNQIDAEIMLAKIKNAGYKLTANPADSDIVIINTCGFIEAAKKEAIEEIFNFIRLKEQGKIKAIIVTGCLAERYREKVLEEIPEIDAVLGIGANNEIINTIESVINHNKIEIFKDKKLLPLNGERVVTTPAHYAYLKVAEGCDNCCSYCAIPQIRGRFRSRKKEDIIAEAKNLAKSGVKELILIAQDTTRYGEDLYHELYLPKLLLELCEIPEIKWIRLLYCYPDKITDELISVIKSQEKILKYLDLPLQHCSGKILKCMSRTGDTKSLTALINKLKSEIPQIILRTTFIVGFPGETDDDFNELCDFINDIKFDRLGCFTYSAEEGTRACSFNNQVDEDIKKHRQEILMNEQLKIVTNKNREMINQEVLVVTEGFDDKANCYFGRSFADSPDIDGKVFFKSDKLLRPGDFITVKITDFIDYDLIGTAIKK